MSLIHHLSVIILFKLCLTSVLLKYLDVIGMLIFHGVYTNITNIEEIYLTFDLDLYFST